MIEIKGKYGEAKVFTDTLEPSAERLIKTFCDQPYSAQSKIRIMPDVHAGKGCTIGTTLTVKDAVVPNVVGVDIGCGMLTVKLSSTALSGRTFRAAETSEKEATGATDGLTFMSFFV